ncbi:MAG TPA: enoyl-CoA hydratase/isomerase family protein [Dehalococcoidia bacterium]
MAYNTILHERIGSHIHKITLNRPERLNAMTSELQLEVTAVCREIENDRDARCLVITGAGRAFCAGADVSGMAERQNQTPDQMVQAVSLEDSRQGLRRARATNDEDDLPLGNPDHFNGKWDGGWRRI